MKRREAARAWRMRTDMGSFSRKRYFTKKSTRESFRNSPSAHRSMSPLTRVTVSTGEVEYVKSCSALNSSFATCQPRPLLR